MDPLHSVSALVVLSELVSRWKDIPRCGSLQARALRSRLVRVYPAMLLHLSFGFEFGTAGATLVFFPE